MKTKKLQKHKARWIIIGVLIFLSLAILHAGLVQATTSFNSITADQPVGTISAPANISGMYSFEASITVGSGYSYESSSFTIAGTTYTPSVAKTSANPFYTLYTATYSFTTGILTNGLHSWYANVTISGDNYNTSTEYFNVDNSIEITFNQPTSGQIVSGASTISVTAISTSTNTVSTVTANILGHSIALSLKSNDQWEGIVNYASLPNAITSLSISATGTNLITGHASETITVSNIASNKFDATYYDGSASYYEPVSPLPYGPPIVVSHTVYQPGQLSLYPNSLTTEVTVGIPDTIPSVQSVYFPPDVSPYYSFSSSSAKNWTNQSKNPLNYTNSIVDSNSPFGTPFLHTSSTSTVNVSSPLTAANLSSGAWTIGGYFYAPTNSALFLGGNSYGGFALDIVATTDGAGAFYPTILFANGSSGGTFDIVLNKSVSINTWFSLVFTFNHSTVTDIENEVSLVAYIDGNTVGWHTLPGNTYNGVGIQGIGTILIPLNTGGESLFDLFFADAVLTASEVNRITSPAPFQIYTNISPPMYAVNQNYFGIAIRNGSQPWSSLELSTYQLMPDAYGTVTINLQSPLGQQSVYQYSLNISFMLPLSSQRFYLTTFSNSFSAPMFSSLDISVKNTFGQTIGSLTNLTLNQTSETVTVYLNLAQIVFQFVNTTEGEVTLSSNGISLNYFASAIVANNSMYNWSTNVFANGKSKTYSGTFQTDSVYNNLTIFADAPIASLNVFVLAYNASGVGYLSGSNPLVHLYIDGNLTQIGTTYFGKVGQTLNIVLKDSLNQTLDEVNYTLQSQTDSLTLNITTKSWILSVKNDEQALPNSTLATEVIKVTNRAMGVNASFRNSVGQSLALYLVQGNYSLYLHDNATFNANVTLNQSEFYIIFGQQLLTLQAFDSKQNEIYNNTAHLMVTPVVAPVDSLQGSPIQYKLDLQFPNGTSLNDSDTRGIVQNGTFAFYLNANGTLVTQATLLAGSSSDVMAQLTISKPGSYNGIFLSFISSSGTIFSMRYSATLQVLSLSNFSYGIKVALSGPLTVQVNHTASFFILLTYGNGSALNYSDTLSAQHNITVTVYHDGLFIATLPVSLVSAGKLTFTYTPLQLSSGYSIIVIVSPTTIGTAKASAESTLSFSAVGYNPTLSPGQDVLNSLVRFLSGSTNLIVILITIAGGLYGTYRFLRRRRIRLEQKLEAVDSAIQAQIIAQNLTTEQRQAVIRAIPVKVKKKLINVITGKEAVE